MRPHRHRIRVLTAIVGHEVRDLAERAAALCASCEPPPRFRALSEAETEAVLGGELLAALSGGRGIEAALAKPVVFEDVAPAARANLEIHFDRICKARLQNRCRPA